MLNGCQLSEILMAEKREISRLTTILETLLMKLDQIGRTFYGMCFLQMVPMPFKWFQSLSKASFGRRFSISLYIFFHQSTLIPVRSIQYSVIHITRKTDFPTKWWMFEVVLAGCWSRDSLARSAIGVLLEVPILGAWDVSLKLPALDEQDSTDGLRYGHFSIRKVAAKLLRVTLWSRRRSLALFKSSRFSYVWEASQKGHSFNCQAIGLILSKSLVTARNSS